MKITNYDNTQIYEEQIAPMIAEIEKICTENKMPFFATVAVANDENKTVYKSLAKTPIPMDVVLTNEHITKHINVLNGFEIILPEHITDIEI